MDTTIKTRLHQVNQAISSNICSDEEINHLFNAIKNLIDEFEGEGSEALYCSFRHEYHVKRATYFRIMNRDAEAKKEKMLADKYSTKADHDNDQVLQAESIKVPACNNVANTDIEGLKQKIDSVMQDIRPETDDIKWKELHDLISKASAAVLSSFADYLELQYEFTLLNNVLKESSIELLILNSDNGSTQTVFDNSKYRSKIVMLQVLCNDLQLQCSAEFARYLLSDGANVDNMLFGDIPLTEHAINNCYKQLARLFHPNIAFQTEFEGVFNELFQKIVRIKESKMEVLKERSNNIGKAQFYESEGNLEWAKAIDCKNAIKSNYNFKVLNQSIRNWSFDDLEKAKTEHALLAFENYRSAIIALGAQADLDTSVCLRKNIALCFILAGSGSEYMMEAELYAMAAIYIIVDQREALTVNEYKLQEMHRILDKVRNATTSQSNKNSMPVDENKIASTTETSLVSYFSEITMRNVSTGSQSVTGGQRERMKGETVRQMCNRLIVSADAKDYEKFASIKDILHAKRQAISYKFRGVTVGTVGVAYGVAFCLEGGGNLLTLFTAGSIIGAGALVSPLVMIATGIPLILAGFIGGYKILKNARALMNEPNIREKLNNIMQEAIVHFSNNKFDEFFESLASPYTSMTNNAERPLIEFTKGIDIVIDPKHVVTQLLKHAFRPDGIVWLLNTMGEVLVRREIKLDKKQPILLCVLAMALFQEIYDNEVLRNEATRLDECVNNAKFDKKKELEIWQKMFGTLLRIHAEKFYAIPSEYLKEKAMKAPYTARLDEMRTIARINIAMCHLLLNESSSLQHAKTILREVKTSLTRKFQFFGSSELRNKALQDWLFLLGEYDEPYQAPDSFLALSEVLSTEELEQIHFVTVENSHIPIQHFIAVNQEMDLWECAFYFLPEAKAWSRQQFIDNVQESYKSDAKFKKMMDEELKINKQGLLSIQNWCLIFLNDKHIFKDQYLPVIAYMLNLQFYYCIMSRKSAFESIFETYGLPISAPRHKPIHRRIYILVDSSTRSTILGLFIAHDSTYLQYNLACAKVETDLDQKVQILMNIAHIYSQDAEICDAADHILAMSKWSETLEIYEKMCQCAPNDHNALLGNAKCLLKLHKYNRAEQFLMQRKQNLQANAEYWIMLCIAQRQQYNKKEDALFSINHALKIQPESIEAAKERKLILRQLKTKESIPYKYTYSFNSHRSQLNTEHPTYNILSIDGGGIRGILPGVWLTELERKTRRPIATMSDMISGTSTGGIIAAGLSMPALSRPPLIHGQLGDIQLGKTGLPQYTASQILELYTKRCRELFTVRVFPGRSFDRCNDRFNHSCS